MYQDYNYTDVPNDLIENMARCKLSGSEHRILFAVIRTSQPKRNDRNSPTILSAYTGISNRECSRIATRLINRKILKKSDGMDCLTVEINPMISEWVIELRGARLPT